MSSPLRLFAAGIAAASLVSGDAPAQDTARAGAGSYLLKSPPDAKGPPETVYTTEAVRGPIPTGDWWSSLAWTPFSEPQYAHPLVVKAEPCGLRVYHAAAIHADKIGIFGTMPGAREDLVLGHAACPRFPDARLHGFSDWFVTARFASAPAAMEVTYGHGGPFVFAMFKGGDATVTFPTPPKVWSGDAGGPALGVSVGTKAYGLFGPGGCAWEGLGTTGLVCRLRGRRHFSLAILPARTSEVLDLFARHAHAHVTDSRVEWTYDEPASAVTTRFRLTTVAREGAETNTLCALYPHQWETTADALLELGYPSVRGPMRLLRGNAFATRMTYPGLLPFLPAAGAGNRERLRRLIAAAAEKPDRDLRDTYWGGKRIGWLATLIPIAEQAGALPERDRLLEELRGRLERWFTAAESDGRSKSRGCFAFNRTWGAAIGYPASYGSDTDLSDHHFHYGYFLRGAAEVCRGAPAWGATNRWGEMARLLVRDIANPSRTDPDLPFLRCFDPYAGHSWASGRAGFADGNNQESSSEAMNAWAGILLFGEAVGDRELRDLGAYLFATELAAIERYWFNVEGRLRPAAYTPSVVTMVWGGKGVNETWFSRNPEVVHGINWLPFGGPSLYLGRYPDYARRNYEALKAENGGETWDEWADIVWMYRALSDPADALRQFEAAGDRLRAEAGNSLAHTISWIEVLNAFGAVDRTVTADCPLYAVFRKDGRRTHVAYNMGQSPRTVRFSDGTTVRVEPRSFGMSD